MSSIIIPRKWQTQPQYPVYAGSPKFLSCNGQLNTRVSGAADLVATTKGISLKPNPTGAVLKYPAVTELSNSLSIVLSLVGSAWINNTVLMSQRSAWSATGIPFELVAITGPNIGVRIIGNTNNTQYAFTLDPYFNTFVVTWNGASESVYHNGRFLGSTARSGTITNNTTNCTLNGLPDGTAQSYQQFLLAAVYDRVLSDPKDVSSNPFSIFRKQPQVLYFDVGGAGAQTLTQSAIFTDGDTFHAATVSAGAVTLTPSLYSDVDTFHAATITLGGAAQDLTPTLFADGDTFHAATVAAGSVNLAPSLVTDGDTFHAATVAPGSVTLTPSLVSDGDTFYTHALVLEGGPQTLSPDLFADGDTFHAATVTPGAVTLTPSLYTDPDTFHAAEVSSGFNLQPPAYADADTFYPATVAAGAVSLAPDLFVDGDAFHSPTVSLASTQTLTPDLFADADTFYVPTLTGGMVILGAARSAGRQLQTGARSNIQTNRR